MKSIRNWLAGSVVGGAVLCATAGLTWAYADAPATTTTAAPTPPAHWHGHHGWGGPGRFLHQLGLTADQQASVKAILTAAKPQMKTLHDTQQANHLKLMQTKPDDPNYANVSAEVAQSNAALASQRTSQGAELWAQIYAVLTPAQKTQLATLQAQWAASPHQGHWGTHAPAGSPAAAATPAPSGS